MEGFLVINKANQVKFLEKTFLVANVSSKIIFKMLFLTLSSANIDFLDCELWWKTYITQKALLTTKRIELVERKKFTVTALNLECETFIVYVMFLSFIASLSSTLLNANVHPSYRPEIASLIAKKASTKVPNKYANFADIFYLDLAFKLFKHTGMNNHAIELVDG